MALCSWLLGTFPPHSSPSLAPSPLPIAPPLAPSHIHHCPDKFPSRQPLTSSSPNRLPYLREGLTEPPPCPPHASPVFLYHPVLFPCFPCLLSSSGALLPSLSLSLLVSTPLMPPSLLYLLPATSCPFLASPSRLPSPFFSSSSLFRVFFFSSLPLSSSVFSSPSIFSVFLSLLPFSFIYLLPFHIIISFIFSFFIYIILSPCLSFASSL